MSSPVDLLLGAGPLTITSRIVQPARSESLADIPAPYDNGAIGNWVRTMSKGRDQIWLHQAKALELIADAKHVAIATSTASGKSLVFQAPIIREMLEGEATALVFMPIKALAGDQLERFRAALMVAGLPVDLVGEINGDVPTYEREAALRRARILLVTPDAAHAYLMRGHRMPLIRSFLQRLHVVVIDEAHTYEGVFGSNSAYFFRRLQEVHCHAAPLHSLQFIAASATISEPEQTLESLTGCDFSVIGEADNGAPSHARTILHIDGPDYGAPAEAGLAAVLRKLAPMMGDNAFIAFADARQGVERIVREIGIDNVLPYRSGYEGPDRRRIEAALRGGKLAGVVSTSALELGIDVPQFVIGLNLGVPASHKAFHQRLGRIGRACPGVFGIIAPPSNFAQAGTSLREFVDAPIEPSHFYLDNRFIQFAHARCLLDECSDAESRATLKHPQAWPAGFIDMLSIAMPGARRPADLDQLAMLGGDNSHRAYSLRQVCEGEFALKLTHNGGDKIGTIQFDKALRETYPGATYYHMGRAHKVRSWHTSTYERCIRLQPVKHAQPTQAILNTLASVSFESGEILYNRLLASDKGCLAEIYLRVCESVEGYRAGGTTLLYSDLRKENPAMSRKRRELVTTGVVLRILEPWFAGSASHQVNARQRVAQALEQMLIRHFALAAGDIRVAYTNIALCTAAGPRKVDDVIAIFDNTHGALRLSAPLFSDFSTCLDNLNRALDLAGADALLSEHTLRKLSRWHTDLGSSIAPAAVGAPDGSDGFVIFAPQSRVGVRIRGMLQERVLGEPQFLSYNGSDILMYRYEAAEGVDGWVAHDQVEPVGHDWRRVIWDPNSNLIRELGA